TTVNIRLRDILTVKNSNGYTVNARDFDIGSQHGCGTVKEFEISFDNGPFKPSLTFIEAYRGQTVLLRIRYKVNAAYFNYGTVKVWFLNENEPAPLELFVYDDFLKKGKEYTLAVQSQNFKAVFGFQLGLKIQEAVLNKCESGDIKITYNEPIKGNVRLIFVDEKSVGNTVSPDVPIFLIKLTPNRDGFASEFLSLSEEVMYSEAVYFNQVSKVKMKMFFPQRALTDSEDFGLEQQLKVYPNPVNSDDFHIVLPESFSNEVQISMFDIQGKLCSASTKIIENKTLSLTLPMELKNGLYFLKIFDGKKHKSAKIILQR
ncbi:MAG: T9SS type A sorting domain-containing protein, partial [Saprospiraceae bacterium]